MFYDTYEIIQKTQELINLKQKKYDDLSDIEKDKRNNAASMTYDQILSKIDYYIDNENIDKVNKWLDIINYHSEYHKGLQNYNNFLQLRNISNLNTDDHLNSLNNK